MNPEPVASYRLQVRSGFGFQQAIEAVTYLSHLRISHRHALCTDAGYGYQTMINEALRKYLEKAEKPFDESVLRQAIREELERISAH